MGENGGGCVCVPPYNNPLLLILLQSIPMKFNKYIFLMHHAVERVSSRMGVKHWSPQELFVLYSIQYLPMSSNQSAIIRHAKRMCYPIGQSTISEAVTNLREHGLIEVSDGRHSLSHIGREYLSSIRRFLINKRL